MVRTQDFHSCNGGSIPPRTTRLFWEQSKIMANLKSAKKRVRQNEKHRLHNRYYAKTTRTAVRDLRNERDAAKAVEMLPVVQRHLDRLVKMNIIHRNKAANLKSQLAKHVNKLQAETAA